ELSATQRDAALSDDVFAMTAEEEAELRVAKRLNSSKTMRFFTLGDGGSLPEEVLRHAEALEKEHPEPKRAVVYVRLPKEAAAIADRLRKRFGPDRVAVLTGTIRGHERDQMANPAIGLDDITDAEARGRARIFRGFRAKPGREPPPATEY